MTTAEFLAALPEGHPARKGATRPTAKGYVNAVAKATGTKVLVCVVVPIRAVSEANSHTHWRLRQQRAKQQRKAAWAYLIAEGKAPPLPVTVTLTRLAPRELDDDNLHGALKHFRDGVADWFGVDDGDKRYTWVVRQEKSKTYGVRISVAPVSGTEGT
jgi:hypothetical protein